MAALQELTTTAYRQFEENPFIIRQDLRHIFLTPLSQRLKHDLDGLQCFLSIYEIGKQEQTLALKRSFEQTKQFFFPHSLLTLVIRPAVEEHSDLSCSMSGVHDGKFSRSDSTAFCSCSHPSFSDSSIASSAVGGLASVEEKSADDKDGSLDNII